MKRLIVSVFLFFVSQSGQCQQWNDVGGGINQWVNAMEVDTANNLLYVGGLFTTAGSTSANSIATWNPTNSSWSALGNGLTYQGNLAVGTALSANDLQRKWPNDSVQRMIRSK